MQGIQEWILKWKTNEWKTANKKDVKNKDLWMDLDELVELHNIDSKFCQYFEIHVIFFENLQLLFQILKLV